MLITIGMQQNRIRKSLPVLEERCPTRHESGIDEKPAENKKHEQDQGYELGIP